MYGCYEPTLIQVPFKHLKNKSKFKLITTELFGPVSVVVEYKESQTDEMLEYV